MTDVGLVENIALDAGLSEISVVEIIQNAPARYKVYTIPKKGGGYRIIAQPARELKAIQRSISKLVLENMPVHGCAVAYRKRIGILHNATMHSGSNPILKLDFEKFFNSITAEAWTRYLSSQKTISLSRREITLLTRALFWGEGKADPRCLSIGAPTSPLVSNVLMFAFDVEMSTFSTIHGITYTRYADDITVSSRDIRTLQLFERHLRQYINRIRTPALTLNEEKRAIYSAGNRRMVTGLILTPDGKVSIGRDRKREISALIHRFSLGILPYDRHGYLHGMLAFAVSIEPEFASRMSEKYGNDIIRDILHYRVPRRNGSPR